MDGERASGTEKEIPSISNKGIPIPLKIEDTEAGPIVTISNPLGVPKISILTCIASIPGNIIFSLNSSE